ncbi:probable starch synthase 4, chloroplastic/amyloplastic isoform X1 [Punica granatum]|uniref:starch synthase n=3 Tax=Punica granatum TaxID=22663 RepID=A0A6P8D425_PUNGR|nr:probable starch synthase 4, chloroplastic/amyloplastic isoform X1 [Punica granatum]
MSSKISTCFLSHGLTGLNHRSSNVRFLASPSHRLLPSSCRMRHRSFSLQNKKHHVKKMSSRRPSIIINGEMEPENIASQNVPIGSQEIMSNSDSDLDSGDGSDEDLTNQTIIDVENENDAPNESRTLSEAEKTNLVQNIPELQAIVNDAGQQLSGLQMEDLVGMIRNAEKNIVLLDQARVRALNDLGSIMSEKEALQGEINVLEMKLVETDARMKVAAQEKLHVELLEDQLEKLKDELVQRSRIDRNESDVYKDHDYPLNQENSPSHHSIVHPHMYKDHKHPLNRDDSQPMQSSIYTLREELRSLRTENESLKNDIQALRDDLNGVKSTDERVIILEKEQSYLESALKNLESKLSDSREDVSKLSTLKFEYKDLLEKVENLQVLLDKATKQADQAILELQQNQELQKKVDKLEESLKEANIYKLSSEKLQQYNELMQQKIKLLEDRLERSDEEVLSYLQLYQESVQEFQDTLNSLKEESNKRALNEPVDDLPREFWSHLLLRIDGWFLEKKISANDANLLGEMVWKRERRICNAYMVCKEKNERDAISTFVGLISKAPTSPGLHVVHIAAEMAPVAKVGGLGDVVTGLSKALQKKGHLVEIILPKYDCMQYDRVRDLRALDFEVESYFEGRLFKNKIWIGTIEGLPVYFIEPLHPDKFFWRGQFYGEHDDFKRFSFFSRAALELLLQAGKKPDIIHCHDWQTAFVAPLYWDLYAPKGLNSARICFTCHNFEYQGTAPASEMASCGLDVQQLNRPDRMQDNSSHERVNPIKGAVVFSNIVTTVSPTYAQEVRTAEGGRGLHTTLNLHSKKFIGILNGIDTDAWNPASDSFLEVQYSATDVLGKAENKSALRRQLGLSRANPRQPLVSCITRLVPQKGVHLIRHAMYRTMELGGQFILLGSSPILHIQREFEGIVSQFQNHDHVRLILKYDESLSHRIYAASDMFIIPSIFEPCGLTQMIAMRYGSIPIARKTGGLNDSVFDVDDDTVPLQFRNGFTFLNADEQGLSSAFERAFNHYNNSAETWQQLVQKVMNLDFSWDSSASQYEELYSKSVARARAAQRT